MNIVMFGYSAAAVSAIKDLLKRLFGLSEIGGGGGVDADRVAVSASLVC